MFNERKPRARVPLKRRGTTWRERHPKLKKVGIETAKTGAALGYSAAGAVYVASAGTGSTGGRIFRAAVWNGAGIGAVQGYKAFKRRGKGGKTISNNRNSRKRRAK